MTERVNGRRRMLTQPGRIYAARSRALNWIKVGFSLDVERRLTEVNRRFHVMAPFDLIGSTPGVYESERQLHRILRPFRHNRVGLSREIYPALPIVEKIVTEFVAAKERPPLDHQAVSDCARWAIRRAYQDDLSFLVRDFYALAASYEYREAQ